MGDPGDPYDLDAGTSEHYDDALLYDWEYRRRRADVNFYRGLARRFGSPVVELGAGSGRVLIALARDGHQGIGVDLSYPMLRRAATRLARLAPRARARVRLIRGDMRRWPLALRAPLVICPFNAFQHLYTRADIAACLGEVRANLARDGRFAFDVMNPDLRWLTRDPNRRWARTRFRHPTTGRLTEYTTNQTYDPIAQIAYIRIYYQEGGRTRVVRLCHRQFFPAELEEIVSANGFRVEERWGGFSGEPLEAPSESQVLLCIAR